ncbi:MAG: hypothetical protein AABW54_02620 [Candidatus Micrarchaeota archaeon]
MVAVEERPPRSLLRFVFPDANRGVRKAATELGVEQWSTEAIRHYFIQRHNDHVLKGAMRGVPAGQLHQCLVRTGVVKAISRNFLEVQIGGETERVLKGRAEPQIGLQVAVHYRQAVDVLPQA